MATSAVQRVSLKPYVTLVDFSCAGGAGVDDADIRKLQHGLQSSQCLTKKSSEDLARAARELRRLRRSFSVDANRGDQQGEDDTLLLEHGFLGARYRFVTRTELKLDAEAASPDGKAAEDGGQCDEADAPSPEALVALKIKEFVDRDIASRGKTDSSNEVPELPLSEMSDSKKKPAKEKAAKSSEASANVDDSPSDASLLPELEQWTGKVFVLACEETFDTDAVLASLGNSFPQCQFSHGSEQDLESFLRQHDRANRVEPGCESAKVLMVANESGGDTLAAHKRSVQDMVAIANPFLHRLRCVSDVPVLITSASVCVGEQEASNTGSEEGAVTIPSISECFATFGFSASDLQDFIVSPPECPIFYLLHDAVSSAAGIRALKDAGVDVAALLSIVKQETPEAGGPPSSGEEASAESDGAEKSEDAGKAAAGDGDSSSRVSLDFIISELRGTPEFANIPLLKSQPTSPTNASESTPTSSGTRASDGSSEYDSRSAEERERDSWAKTVAQGAQIALLDYHTEWRQFQRWHENVETIEIPGGADLLHPDAAVSTDTLKTVESQADQASEDADSKPEGESTADEDCVASEATSGGTTVRAGVTGIESAVILPGAPPLHGMIGRRFYEERVRQMACANVEAIVSLMCDQVEKNEEHRQKLEAEREASIAAAAARHAASEDTESSPEASPDDKPPPSAKRSSKKSKSGKLKKLLLEEEAAKAAAREAMNTARREAEETAQADLQLKQMREYLERRRGELRLECDDPEVDETDSASPHTAKIFHSGDDAAMRLFDIAASEEQIGRETQAMGSFLVPGINRHLMDKAPLCEANRGIALNEQFSFSTLPIEKFRREKLILELDDIMKSYRQNERSTDGSSRAESPEEEAIRNREWNFGGRSFSEQLPAHVTSQMLARVIRDPLAEVKTRFMSVEDALLIVSHIPTPHSRKRVIEEAYFTPRALSFSEWRRSPSQVKYTKPRMFYSWGNDEKPVESLRERSTLFYPSDQSVFGVTSFERVYPASCRRIEESREISEEHGSPDEREADTKSDQDAVAVDTGSPDTGSAIVNSTERREELTRRMWIRQGDLRVEFAGDGLTDGFQLACDLPMSAHYRSVSTPNNAVRLRMCEWNQEDAAGSDSEKSVLVSLFQTQLTGSDLLVRVHSKPLHVIQYIQDNASQVEKAPDEPYESAKTVVDANTEENTSGVVAGDQPKDAAAADEAEKNETSEAKEETSDDAEQKPVDESDATVPSEAAEPPLVSPVTTTQDHVPPSFDDFLAQARSGHGPLLWSKSLREISRRVAGAGSDEVGHVEIRYENGLIRKLFANGNTHESLADDPADREIVTSLDGTRRVVVSPPTSEETELAPLQIAVQSDPESHAMVYTREDLMVFIRYAPLPASPRGATMTESAPCPSWVRFADGTQIFTDVALQEDEIESKLTTSTFIESPGFAAVRIDHDSQSLEVFMPRAHAYDSKDTNFLRNLRTSAPVHLTCSEAQILIDAGAVTHDADQQGSHPWTFSQPRPREVRFCATLAQDPPSATRHNDGDNAESDARERSSSGLKVDFFGPTCPLTVAPGIESGVPTGVYRFDFAKGSISIEDADENRFAVHEDATVEDAGTSCSLSCERGNINPQSGQPDLIPMRYHAAPEHPIEPRLFVIRGAGGNANDGCGSGFELLTTSAASKFVEKACPFSESADESQRDGTSDALGPWVALPEEPSQQIEVPNEKFADDSASLKFLCQVSRPPRYYRRVEIPAVVRASLENEINGDFIADGDQSGSAGTGSYLVYKHMLEMVPLSLKDREVVAADLKRYQEWKAEQQKSDKRYEIADDGRSPEEVAEAKRVQDMILKERLERESSSLGADSSSPLAPSGRFGLSADAVAERFGLKIASADCERERISGDEAALRSGSRSDAVLATSGGAEADEAEHPGKILDDVHLTGVDSGKSKGIASNSMSFPTGHAPAASNFFANPEFRREAAVANAVRAFVLGDSGAHGKSKKLSEAELPAEKVATLRALAKALRAFADAARRAPKNKQKSAAFTEVILANEPWSSILQKPAEVLPEPDCEQDNAGTTRDAARGETDPPPPASSEQPAETLPEADREHDSVGSTPDGVGEDANALPPSNEQGRRPGSTPDGAGEDAAALAPPSKEQGRHLDSTHDVFAEAATARPTPSMEQGRPAVPAELWCALGFACSEAGYILLEDSQWLVDGLRDLNASVEKLEEQVKSERTEADKAIDNTENRPQNQQQQAQWWQQQAQQKKWREQQAQQQQQRWQQEHQLDGARKANGDSEETAADDNEDAARWHGQWEGRVLVEKGGGDIQDAGSALLPLAHYSSTGSIRTNRPSDITLLGKPRKEPIRLGGIFARGAAAEPNVVHAKTEGSVKRYMRTASLARDSSSYGEHKFARFKVTPAVFAFGRIRPKASYRMAVTLVNEGNTQGRFQVKQPTSPTKDQTNATNSVQVLYRPGPVAPGMRRQLELELTASRAEERLVRQVVIATEHDIFRVAVTACVTEDAAPLLKLPTRVRNPAIGQPRLYSTFK